MSRKLSIAEWNGETVALYMVECDGKRDGCDISLQAGMEVQFMSEVLGPDELVTRLPDVRRWFLEVLDSTLISPQVRRIRLGSPELQSLQYQVGQDMMLWVPMQEGRMVFRRYTIRSFDRSTGSVTLDFLRHGGDGPGIRWAEAARPRDRVEVVGPRGKITIVAAGWHLFAGDESFIPAAFAMIEALPAGTPALAFLEVAGPEEEQPLSVSADVRLTWVYRGETPAGNPTALVAAVQKAELPAIPGHAYVGAELRVASALRRALEERGMEGDLISSKAYWGRGRANAGHGEPNRD